MAITAEQAISALLAKGFLSKRKAGKFTCITMPTSA